MLDFVSTQNRTCPYVLFCTPAAALLGRCNNTCLQISQVAHGLIEFLLFHHLQFSFTEQTRQTDRTLSNSKMLLLLGQRCFEDGSYHLKAT